MSPCDLPDQDHTQLFQALDVPALCLLYNIVLHMQSSQSAPHTLSKQEMNEV